jgi:hypothetical protein
MGAYEKADRVAKGRGEAVDPFRSRKGAKAGEVAGGRGGVTDQSRVEEWKDRAASVSLRLLIGYGEIDPQLLSGAGETTLKFRLIEKGGRKGFQVFRAYGGVEVPGPLGARHAAAVPGVARYRRVNIMGADRGWHCSFLAVEVVLRPPRR